GPRAGAEPARGGGGEPAAGGEAARTGGAPLVVSAGKTERDTATLISAVAALGLRARIYVDEPRPAPAGIELVRAADYATVLADLRRAAIVAIPLTGSERLLGLSEVDDALALGKPIVMTRSHFDPAAVGCGLTVAPGDEAGWREALARLAGDAALRERLGRRGREFAERGHIARAFGEAIVSAVATAGSRSRPRGRRRGR
ncbi:MAG TPA: hypothetical protein VFG79_05315, partial [Solirubrobacter sp.]|nr:hypothetical protein [Solirubrobacter sp.]